MVAEEWVSTIKGKKKISGEMKDGTDISNKALLAHLQ